MPRKFDFDALVAQLDNTDGLTFPDRNLIDGKLRVLCAVHGEFWTTPGNLKRGTRCVPCTKPVGDRDKKQQRAAADVLARFRAAHGDRYDYSRVVYAGAHVPVDIVCPVHGVFQQSPVAHRNGHGCNECANVVRAEKRRAGGVDTFLDRFSERFGDRFRVETPPRVMTDDVTVWCVQHGRRFTTRATKALSMVGCPDCISRSRVAALTAAGAHRKSADTRMALKWSRFEALARQVHGDKYDYSECEYAGSQGHLTITCRTCATKFDQTYDHHITRRQGCPKCSHHLSRAEDDIFRLVSAFAPDTKQRVRGAFGDARELDVYVPSKQLGIEYCGMYWHSHGSADKEKTDKFGHQKKHAACEAAGISLLTVFETDWVQHKLAVTRAIRARLGKLRGRLMARNLALRAVDHGEATKFFDKYHVQGGAGAGETLGLFHKDKLVACMRFTFGGNDRGRATKAWTLSRYATRVSVVGGASRLFRAFVAQFQPDTVKSFSDSRLFGGKMYEHLGFELESESAPDYMVWHPRLGVLPKTKFQRSEIAARQAELGVTVDFDASNDPRSETDMTYLLKCRRIYDCGKKKWVWTSK